MSDADRGPALAELGEALMRRMVALGLPITGDVARDVAGFERHVHARALTGLGAWALTAQRLLPVVRDALDAATRDGEFDRAASLDPHAATTLYQLLRGVEAAREQAGEGR